MAAKVMEIEKKVKDRIAKAGQLTFEAFKASPKFIKIKVEFGGEAFVVQRITKHHPKWDVSFLDNEEEAENLASGTKVPLATEPPLGLVADEVPTPIVFEVQP